MPFEPVPALRPDAHVRIIAPGSPFPRADFDRGVARLRERYRVSLGAAVLERDGYLAGDDEARLADLLDALRDPDVDAIVAARGGYGASRLLPRLPLDAIRARPKLLVGFSDVTALHARWARAGLRSLHAHMVTGLGRAGEAELRAWIEAVEGTVPAPLEGLRSLAPGAAEGPLMGGNLALICALLGTPDAVPLEGAILLLEDIGEAPYRVDRMLTQLRQAGLASVAGIVLGDFTGCAPRADGREIHHVLRERLADLPVPVARSAPFGHEPRNLPAHLGAPARLDADRGVLTLRETSVTTA